jgi:hypothetical protein
MTAHSQGPWRVVFSKKNGAALSIQSSEGWDVPGAVCAVVRQNGIGMPACNIGKANARLIAAAPDMLAALQYVSRHGHDVALPSDFAGIVEAAIAKAEGQS